VFTPGSGTEFGGSLRAKFIVNSPDYLIYPTREKSVKLLPQRGWFLQGFNPFNQTAATLPKLGKAG
jgi:hypothetical protein